MLSFVVVVGAMLYSLDERRRAAPPREPADLPRPVAGGPPLPPPASGIEFEGLRDKTGLTGRDNPAYLTLLERVRERSAEELARESNRGVFFAQLIGDPARYRGLPIHVNGRARRVMRQETPGSRLFAGGSYLEIYATSPDSGKYPWIFVVEEAPAGFPIGGDLNEPIAFDGYFLKLLAYEAADTFRFAPLLIGRVRWEKSASPPPRAMPGLSVPPWAVAAIGLLLGLMLLRWAIFARGIFRPSAPRPTSPAVVRDEIEPEELSAWVESQGEPEPDDDLGEREDWR